MSKMSSNHAAEPIRKNRVGSLKVSVYALQVQIHSRAETQRLSGRDAKRALQLYVDGMNLRRIGRHLSIHHRTVSLGVVAHAASLPEEPLPGEVKEAEMDELFTLIGNKKRSTSSRA